MAGRLGLMTLRIQVTVRIRLDRLPPTHSCRAMVANYCQLFGLNGHSSQPRNFASMAALWNGNQHVKSAIMLLFRAWMRPAIKSYKAGIDSARATDDGFSH